MRGLPARSSRSPSPVPRRSRAASAPCARHDSLSAWVGRASPTPPPLPRPPTSRRGLRACAAC
eukprot:1601280-Prymnesium_polylepis.1